MIVDASVAVRWYAVDDWTPAARSLLDAAEPLIAPDFFVAEVANVLWKLARADAVADAQAELALRELPQVVALESVAPLAPRAFVIARVLNHAVYDCLYLALAELRGMPMITLDKRLHARTRNTSWAELTVLLGEGAVPT